MALTKHRPDPIYYCNQRGAVAVSIDDGHRLLLPTERVIPLTDAWEESDEDLRAELTSWQRRLLEAHEAEEREDERWVALADRLGDEANSPAPPDDIDIDDLLGS